MAGYRQIHTQIWKDEWFIELEPDEKFLFIYLFSNELASISGLYKIPVRVMHNETGISIARVKEIIALFVEQKKIQYADGTLWIRNMWRYHSNASPRTQTKVWNDINTIPDCQVKHNCIQYLHSIGIDTLDVLKAKTKAKTKPKDKPESKDEPEHSDIPSAQYGDLEAAFTNVSELPGLSPSPQKAYQAYDVMQKAGVEPQDITAAVRILLKGKYTIVGPQSVVNTAITEKTRRVSGNTQGNESTMEMLNRQMKEMGTDALDDLIEEARSGN